MEIFRKPPRTIVLQPVRIVEAFAKPQNGIAKSLSVIGMDG